jgi:hypothetical protein
LNSRSAVSPWTARDKNRQWDAETDVSEWCAVRCPITQNCLFPWLFSTVGRSTLLHGTSVIVSMCLVSSRSHSHCRLVRRAARAVVPLLGNESSTTAPGTLSTCANACGCGRGGWCGVNSAPLHLWTLRITLPLALLFAAGRWGQDAHGATSRSTRRFTSRRLLRSEGIEGDVVCGRDRNLHENVADRIENVVPTKSRMLLFCGCSGVVIVR